MKKLILLFITVFPLMCFAGKLGYWSVYLNDSLIGQFNSFSNDNEIVLKRESIQQNDTISIIYHNDQPCSKCEYYYAVKDNVSGFKIDKERRSEILKEVFFPLFKIKEFTGSNEFVFFVHENSYIDSKDIYTQLLKLRME